MTRPRLTFLLPLAAVLFAGCTSFTDSNAVARYEDVELSADELIELTDVLTPPNVESDPTDGTAARESITFWVRVEAVKELLDQERVVISDQEFDDATTTMSSAVPNFAELSDAMRDYLVTAQASFVAFAEVPPPTDDDIREFYERGPQRSGITCVAHILVDTEDEANEVVAEAAAGSDFATLAAERSIDSASAADGGVLACAPTGTFATTYVAPFVDAALGAEIGVPTEAVRSDFGYHVIRVRTFDEVQAEIQGLFTPQDFVIARTIEEADVYVDPRYGALDGVVVVPLT